MKRWEYRVYYLYPMKDEELQKLLNSLGADGWELVNAVEYSLTVRDYSTRIYLKREIASR
jgi:hypothetical protein